MIIIVGHIGSDAGYTYIDSNGVVHHVPGWAPEQMLEVRAAASVLQSAMEFKTPGMTEATVSAVHEFVKEQLGETFGEKLKDGAVLIL
jgi:hypothetical protein